MEGVLDEEVSLGTLAWVVVLFELVGGGWAGVTTFDFAVVAAC